MKIDIRKIRKLYRLNFEYLGFIQKDIYGVKNFYIPVNPRFFWKSIKRIFENKKSSNFSNNEKAIISFHEHIYNPDDSVLIVGAGEGISMIYNLKRNRRKRIVVIEGSLDQINIAKKNAKVNGIKKEKYQIKHGYMGNTNGIYGLKTGFSEVKFNINDFKYIDILELDCEGSEVEILESMNIKPKYIIVELHPNLIYINFKILNKIMSDKGYYVILAKTVSGENISIQKLNDYIADFYAHDNKDITLELPVLLYKSVS